MINNTYYVLFSWGGGYAMAYLCYANSDNSWKNAQVGKCVIKMDMPYGGMVNIVFNTDD
jgi:hypothetical protein